MFLKTISCYLSEHTQTSFKRVKRKTMG